MTDLIDRQAAIEQGVDNYGAEYKRTPNDFSFGFLTQDNCVCNICHGTGAKMNEYGYMNLEGADHE